MPSDAAALEARVLADLDQQASGLNGVGVAVSGGGDSMALLHLVARWSAQRGFPTAAATVDHGLRDESATEAALVGQVANSLGLDHTILNWNGGGQGNLMDRARRARLQLLGDWARDKGLGAVALGHTRDDQAETLLMRLSRGAGIDGLAAMAPRRHAEGIVWLRPLLDCGREALRDWLRQIGADWVEDPTNDDLSFDRARIRHVMNELKLEPGLLALSASHLSEARDALNAALLPALAGARTHMGSLHLNRDLFMQLPQEQMRRLILLAVQFVTAADYPPRRAGTDHALHEIALGRRVTLDGTVIDPGKALLFHREPAAASGSEMQGDIWDNRWKISGLTQGDKVVALGSDVVSFDWRDHGLTHLEAQALPAVLRNDQIFCPPILPQDGLVALPIRDRVELIEYRLGIEPRP